MWRARRWSTPAKNRWPKRRPRRGAGWPGGPGGESGAPAPRRRHLVLAARVAQRQGGHRREPAVRRPPMAPPSRGRPGQGSARMYIHTYVRQGGEAVRPGRPPRPRRRAGRAPAPPPGGSRESRRGARAGVFRQQLLRGAAGGRHGSVHPTIVEHLVRLFHRQHQGAAAAAGAARWPTRPGQPARARLGARRVVGATSDGAPGGW